MVSRECYGPNIYDISKRTFWAGALLSGIALAFMACAGIYPAFAQTDQSDAATSQAQAATSGVSDLAKKLQNPVGNLISVPFQENLNFGVGPHDGTQNILNIQPVIPFELNDNWNIVTRTILPLVWNPSFAPAHTVPFGLGATTLTAFLAPGRANNGWVVGAGPIVQLPTATDRSLGSNIWGLGPAVVIVKTAGPVVAGGLLNDVSSLGGTKQAGNRYNLMTFNGFFNYNFGGGWFIGSAPIITANFDAPGTKWTLPVGLQGGRLIKIHNKLPVNILAGAYYNAIRPEQAGTWQLRLQIALIF